MFALEFILYTNHFLFFIFWYKSFSK